MPTFRSTRKGKKLFFVMSLRLSDQKVLHNIASSSNFFRFRTDFLAFAARISNFKFLEFKEFNKTIIPLAFVGYETGYSQLGATPISYPTRAHGIIVKYEVPTIGTGFVSQNTYGILCFLSVV